MRQIKFRGKRIDNGEWVYGSLDSTDERLAISWLRTDEDGEQVPWFAYVKADTVGQFSGLTDQNGKEIYEGDIIRYYDDVEDELVVRPVEYLNDYCAFCAVHPQNDPDGLFAQWQYEVIGNIHDKPELLKGGNDGERL